MRETKPEYPEPLSVIFQEGIEDPSGPTSKEAIFLICKTENGTLRMVYRIFRTHKTKKKDRVACEAAAAIKPTQVARLL